MRTVLIALLVGICAMPSVAQTARTPLAVALEAELDRLPARTSIYVKHLEADEEAAVRADQSFNSQSVIKIPIMVRAFQLPSSVSSIWTSAYSWDARICAMAPASSNTPTSVSPPQSAT